MEQVKNLKNLIEAKMEAHKLLLGCDNFILITNAKGQRAIVGDYELDFLGEIVDKLAGVYNEQVKEYNDAIDKANKSGVLGVHVDMLVGLVDSYAIKTGKSKEHILDLLISDFTNSFRLQLPANDEAHYEKWTAELKEAALAKLKARA